MNITNEDLKTLRVELSIAGVKKKDVAAKLEMSESTLSRILAGTKAAPDSFKIECLDAIHIVQQAERAAKAAFDRVMAGEAPQGNGC